MPGKIRIAYFLDVPYGLGGAGNVLLEQAYLMSAAAEVIVCIPCNEKGIPNQEYVKRCEKRKVKWNGLKYTTSPYMEYIDIVKAFEDYGRIMQFCVEFKISFLHSVQFNIAAELVSRKLRIPHLMNIYQNWTDEPLINFTKYLPLPSFHSCDSLLYCKFWEKWMGSKSFCIRPSAPLEHPYAGSKTDEMLRILMLGMLCDRKNQMAAIKAVKMCIEQGYRIKLTIAGRCDNEYGSKCQEYIDRNNLAKCVALIGFCSDISELLKSHDVILCSSKKESFPSSLVEAATYGLMVISTPVGGVPEIFQNGINAYISNDFRAESLAECIVSYNRDAAVRDDSKIRANLHQTWEEHFSQNAVRNQLQKIYADVKKDYFSISKVKQLDYGFMDAVRAMYMMLKERYGDWDRIYPDPKSRSLYYYYMKNSMGHGTAYIWGAGKYGSIAKDILEYIFTSIEIKGFIDAKKTGIYEGKKIVSTEMMKEGIADYIIIGFFAGREEAIYKLKNKGYFYGKNLWILP